METHLQHLKIIPLEFPRAMTSRSGRTCTMATIFSQMLFFNAATGYALTICLAGLALTTTTLPKISLLPALVAGFVRIYNRAKPGTAKTPVFFTSFAATLARVLSNLEATFCFNSHPLANAFASAPFVIAFAPVFLAAFIGTGNMVQDVNLGCSCKIGPRVLSH